MSHKPESPTPLPDEIKNRLQEFFQEHSGTFDDLIVKLENKDEAAEIIDTSCRAKTLHVRMDNEGQPIVFFTHNGRKFAYYFSSPGRISHYGRVEDGDEMNFNCDECFDDRAFRYLMERIINRHTKTNT